jgi:hypothetical protein
VVGCLTAGDAAVAELGAVLFLSTLSSVYLSNSGGIPCGWESSKRISVECYGSFGLETAWGLQADGLQGGWEERRYWPDEIGRLLSRLSRFAPCTPHPWGAVLLIRRRRCSPSRPAGQERCAQATILAGASWTNWRSTSLSHRANVPSTLWLNAEMREAKIGDDDRVVSLTGRTSQSKNLRGGQALTVTDELRKCVGFCRKVEFAWQKKRGVGWKANRLGGPS